MYGNKPKTNVDEPQNQPMKTKTGKPMNIIQKATIAAAACAAWSLAGSAVAQVTSISPNTPYYIQNKTSGMVLNNGGSTTNGSPITQWNQVNSPNLQWEFVPTSGGYYQIQSVKSGLDVVVKTAATTNSAPLIQWSFGSSGDDQWKPQLTNGFWVFYNLHSGLVINNTSGSTSEGSQYSQYRWASSANEEFNILSAGSSSTNYTAAQVLAGVQKDMVSSKQVNTKPHINTMTRAMNVNVYQVASGVFAYTSSMAIDDDGSDPDPDPDHQDQTTWQDDNGAQLGAHHVPYYVLGDDCWDNEPAQGGDFHPCPHFFYSEHNITGLQFALIFYNGKCIGAVFGDTQGTDTTSTSSNDSRELGEASVESAALLGIPDSGTTGGVDSGVTVVIFSGSQWVVHGTNSTLKDNAQALVQKALNTLGPQL
jgi:hypothetical protein